MLNVWWFEFSNHILLMFVMYSFRDWLLIDLPATREAPNTLLLYKSYSCLHSQSHSRDIKLPCKRWPLACTKWYPDWNEISKRREFWIKYNLTLTVLSMASLLMTEKIQALPMMAWYLEVGMQRCIASRFCCLTFKVTV